MMQSIVWGFAVGVPQMMQSIVWGFSAAAPYKIYGVSLCQNGSFGKCGSYKTLVSKLQIISQIDGEGFFELYESFRYVL